MRFSCTTYGRYTRIIKKIDDSRPVWQNCIGRINMGMKEGETMTLNLRHARRLKEKSQDEMADLLKIHVQTYRRIEENPDSATVEQAKVISRYLGVSYDEIFFAR